MKNTMLDYIKEAPSVVLANVEKSKELTKPLVDEFIKGEYDNIWIVASGSSYNSALIAKDFIREYLEVEVKVIPPATFTNYENEINDNTFIFVISQTGFSTNAIAALNKIKDLGRLAIGVTGNTESDFKDYADLVVDYGVGIETVGYVTKGVTTLVTFLFLFAIESAYKLELISSDKNEELKNCIREIAKHHPQTIDDALNFIEHNFMALSNIGVLYIMGFGANFGTAYEGALKIGETVHIPALPLEMEEYIHGPNLQLSPNYTAIILDNGDKTQERVLEIFEATKVITDKVFLITPNYESEDTRVIKVYDPKNELLNPLAALPVVQVIAYYISDALKVADHPNLKEFQIVAAAKTENYKSND